ncbi:MAG: group III truncated hemoglobin [bacterium]|nr:group III truncated hemoglobin [bacterium]
MNRDIETRADIDHLMREFYSRATSDDVIGYIFTDVAKLDLDHHLPIIGDFWESLLFGTGAYQQHGRNPLMVHRDLHEKSPLTAGHFARWIELFEFCVDKDFAGERADFLKMRARAIALRFQAVLEVEGVGERMIA